jgi:lysosomal Pro-X carboxypeptidase
VFFYTGNEANVELYVNATGLMWETAPLFGALLVFAEHRYFGRSQPFGDSPTPAQLVYLSSEQALADYANLISALRGRLGLTNNMFVAFGAAMVAC